jgi:hypothetical protein
MKRRKDGGPGSGLVHFRSALAQEEGRLRILLNGSMKSTQQSGSVDDTVLFRVTQDRRRSLTNILPYQQRRAADQRC